MKISKILGLLFTTLVLLAGCGEKEVKPVAIDESTDICPVCNMQVKNNEFATQVVLDNDKAHKFDDIGCMYVWLDENGEDEVAAQFVRDYHTLEWIEGVKATYVYNQSIKTPMSYNVISFKDKEDAEQFVEENEGELLTYNDLQEKHEWKMSKMHNHDHHGGEDSHGEDHVDSEMDGHGNGEEHSDGKDVEMDMGEDSESDM